MVNDHIIMMYIVICIYILSKNEIEQVIRVSSFVMLNCSEEEQLAGRLIVDFDQIYHVFT